MWMGMGYLLHKNISAIPHRPAYRPDTDGDDVLDNEDGWARCIDLAPKRIGKRRPKYAVIYKG